MSHRRSKGAMAASSYRVTADDGADDTAGLQKAIDHIKSDCWPNAGFNRLPLIELPAAGSTSPSRSTSTPAS
ncbi:hypothetical protein ACU635_00260 [[Actinomadura] parvosata]|uniref:hypothetical protein n=1 Tax=[Actinomadura] parvosata TaxID=1955412 RepID=UPI00406C6998